MTRKSRALGLILSTVLAVPGLSATKNYGLEVGDKAPAIHQNDISGHPFDLAEAESAGPVVLVFYRGGWCPFCNLQLHDLQIDLVPFAKKNHAQIAAISVDQATEEAKTQAKHDLTITLLSDPTAALLGAYHVQYHVSPKLVKKYKKDYHVDLEAYSGQAHHIIAVPAVFVINGLGTIVYAHADPNYKVRAPESEIKAAITKATK